MTCPLRSTGITPLHHYYEAVRPSPAHRYFRPRVGATCPFSLRIAGQVLTFHTGPRSRFAPPTCRMPLGQPQASPNVIPYDGTPLGFDLVHADLVTSPAALLRS